MMVKIRLKRLGAVKHPKFRVVVIDGRDRRDGRVIEEIGYYDPQKNPAEVRIEEEAALKWLRNGAQPTDTARALLKKAGVLDKLGAAS
ncbi:MAG: 30S ribosomal protein S16 [Cyanobacteria bacterium REEB65]|nr:30S ribosomal protein S16 [Cyanobacteria bacterium REEB65]